MSLDNWWGKSDEVVCFRLIQGGVFLYVWSGRSHSAVLQLWGGGTYKLVTCTYLHCPKSKSNGLRAILLRFLHLPIESFLLLAPAAAGDASGLGFPACQLAHKPAAASRHPWRSRCPLPPRLLPTHVSPFIHPTFRYLSIGCVKPWIRGLVTTRPYIKFGLVGNPHADHSETISICTSRSQMRCFAVRLWTNAQMANYKPKAFWIILPNCWQVCGFWNSCCRTKESYNKQAWRETCGATASREFEQDCSPVSWLYGLQGI